MEPFPSQPQNGSLNYHTLVRAKGFQSQKKPLYKRKLSIAGTSNQNVDVSTFFSGFKRPKKRRRSKSIENSFKFSF